KDSTVTVVVRAEALKQMFWLQKDLGDQVLAFCFGEAALQLQPNDFEFRFNLAYAYGDATGGHAEHDYRDLALFHYRLLILRSDDSAYSRNNSGVAYNHFDSPIHACEQFKAASEMGNALA